MNSNGVTNLRPHTSPPPDRFLTLFSQSHPQNPNGVNTDYGDEFDEDDVLWTPNLDLSHSDHRSDASPPNISKPQRSLNLRRADSSGILAALPGAGSGEFSGDRLLRRKISLPSSSSALSKMIPAIPKPQNSLDRECFLSLPAGNYIPHSAPVNIPVRPKAKGREVAVDELRGYGDLDREMLPPHEIVARSSGQSEMTFSVLEGIGRTLKGRDLRQVRNAVWRQTGFLD